MTENNYQLTLGLGGLDGLAARLHETAMEKGFWDADVDVNFILSKLALVHSEVSEILEAIRKEQGQEAVVTEIADTIIRLLDVYAGLVNDGQVTVSLDDMLEAKMRVNEDRPYRHGVLA